MERLTTQLVKVPLMNNRYEFDFSVLKKYIEFAFAHKIKYINFRICLVNGAGNIARESNFTSRDESAMRSVGTFFPTLFVMMPLYRAFCLPW